MNVSAITGNCATCERKEKDIIIRKKTIAQTLVNTKFDKTYTMTLHKIKESELDEIIEEYSLKPSTPVLYTCIECNTKTEQIVSKFGKTGICQKCADKMESNSKSMSKVYDPKPENNIPTIIRSNPSNENETTQTYKEKSEVIRIPETKKPNYFRRPKKSK